MSTPKPKPLLLDPFAFPSETKGRFRMLIVTAFALAWSLVSYFVAVPNAYLLAFRTDPQAQAAIDKVRDQGSFEGITREEVIRVGRSQAAKDLFRAALYVAARLPLALLLVIALVVGTTLLYLRHPGHAWRHYGLSVLDPETAPTVVGSLRRFAENAGLSPGLRLAVRPGSLDGLAFGRRRQEVVALSGHPKVIEKTWNIFTQAIALHELGHVANDDVWHREVSRALWRVLRVLVVLVACAFAGLSFYQGELRLPMLGSELFYGETSAPEYRLLISLSQTVLIFLLMGWVWAELIRAREFYADWRVAAWGSREILLKRLCLPSSNVPWQGWSLWRALRRRLAGRPWWGSLEVQLQSLWQCGWRHHPNNQRRREMLEDPTALFRVSPQLAFMVGLLVAVLSGQLVTLYNDLTYLVVAGLAPAVIFLGPLVLIGLLVLAVVCTFVITHLITGALGVQVQREAIFDLATRPHTEWRYLRFGIPALLFSVGIEVGFLLTPWGSLAPRALLEMLGWLVGFTGLLWLWLIFMRAMTRLWLGARSGVVVPRSSQRALRWIAAGLLGVLLWPALMARVAIHVAADRSLLDALTMTGSVPPRDRFVMLFVMGSLVLLVMALIFYLTVMFVSILFAVIGLWLRKARCTSCGEKAQVGLVVGRRCGGCGTPLARWMYLSPI